MVAALVLPVSSLRVRLAIGERHLLLTGSQRRTSRCVSRSVDGVGPAIALCWSLRNAGGMQGLVDESIVGSCTGLVERCVQERGGEDRRGG